MRLGIPLLLLASAASGQDSIAQRFAGTWDAYVGQAVVCTIQFKAGDGLAGFDLGCQISVDDDGNLVNSGPLETSGRKPLSRVRLEGNVLVFEVDPEPDEDEPFVLKAGMTLTTDAEAELILVDFPVRVKPIRLVKRAQ